jgi:hypothetical protein
VFVAPLFVAACGFAGMTPGFVIVVVVVVVVVSKID